MRIAAHALRLVGEHWSTSQLALTKRNFNLVLCQGVSVKAFDMQRRNFIKAAAAWTLQPFLLSNLAAAHDEIEATTLRRVRPTDKAWPSQAKWEALRRATQGRLIKVRSPLDACLPAPTGTACIDTFKELKNPYYIEDEVALTQTCGWLGRGVSSIGWQICGFLCGPAAQRPLG